MSRTWWELFAAVMLGLGGGAAVWDHDVSGWLVGIALGLVLVAVTWGEKPGTKLLRLQMTGDFAERFERLRKDSGAQDEAQVVREAFQVYEWYLGRIAEGSRPDQIMVGKQEVAR